MKKNQLKMTLLGKITAINLSRLSLINSVNQITYLLVIGLSICLVNCSKLETSQDNVNNAEEVKNEMASASTSSEDEVFQIAVLPDTQLYMEGVSTSTEYGRFKQQIQWIRDNKVSSKIAYVAHVGDIVNDGETNLNQWIRAKNEIYKLENDNIPYGLAVGNHDQTPFGDAGAGATNDGYGYYFGKSHFLGKSWYGGAYGSSDNNDNHYDLFTSNGVNYIVLYIEFNEEGYHTQSDPTIRYRPDIEAGVSAWANQILSTYSSRKAIIVSHSILNPSGAPTAFNQATTNTTGVLTPQGQKIYDLIAKNNQNVFLMLCGHKEGEAFLKLNNNGHIVKVYAADYTHRANGGDGFMRLMKFNKTQQTLSTRTFAPRIGANVLETDADSEFIESMYN